MAIPGAPQRYAAFRLRFRAYLTDVLIYLAVYLIGAIGSGVVFESYPAGRVAAFALLALFSVSYEPLMIARYAGTFGHRSANIRIVRASDGSLLPFWRAVIRTFVKQLLGLPSLLFMFGTRRAQAFHDIAAGSEVRIRDARRAIGTDYFIPRQP